MLVSLWISSLYSPSNRDADWPGGQESRAATPQVQTVQNSLFWIAAILLIDSGGGSWGAPNSFVSAGCLARQKHFPHLRIGSTYRIQ